MKRSKGEQRNFNNERKLRNFSKNISNSWRSSWEATVRNFFRLKSRLLVLPLLLLIPAKHTCIWSVSTGLCFCCSVATVQCVLSCPDFDVPSSSPDTTLLPFTLFPSLPLTTNGRRWGQENPVIRTQEEKEKKVLLMKTGEKSNRHEKKISWEDRRTERSQFHSLWRRGKNQIPLFLLSISRDVTWSTWHDVRKKERKRDKTASLSAHMTIHVSFWFSTSSPCPSLSLVRLEWPALLKKRRR